MAGTYVQYPPTSTTSSGGGSGANVALSNLSGVSINASLIPASDQNIDLGSSSKNYSNGYIENLISPSISPVAGNDLTLATANNGGGGSGNIALSIGTGSGQGNFQFIKTGVSNSIKDVWTASGTNGVGYWANINTIITGASGTFTTVDSKTVTVVNGIITSIV